MDKKIVEMVKEIKQTKTFVHIPHYYKRKGQMVRRSYDDIEFSPEYLKLRKELEPFKVFKCQECGKMFSFFDLEFCDTDLEEYECQQCYEDEMGEDL